MASGDALAAWRAIDNEPPDDDYATLETLLTVSADEPDDILLVLTFDDAADEYAVFAGYMPEHYSDTTGVTVEIVWCSENTTAAKTCLWNVKFKLVDAADNAGTQTFGANNAFTTDTDSTTANGVNYHTLNVTKGTNMDTIVKNKYFRMQIWRDISGDDLGGNDAKLIAVYLTET